MDTFDSRTALQIARPRLLTMQPWTRARGNTKGPGFPTPLEPCWGVSKQVATRRLQSSKVRKADSRSHFFALAPLLLSSGAPRVSERGLGA
ncbi:hypothetical protein AK812_SmicGene10732 [Symbiodinium microadriaticum]|uniref:Uncharacterized protein n=1 Tax=Symbiodinium microadriaticum TaxID=2951 RepID=A0A1Q9EEX1_SYMMI|nr:hypothetical protein AK812_SmicGene10732 [Symbiodinium microadriaticum]